LEEKRLIYISRDNNFINIKLLIDGWSRIDELRKLKLDSNQAFVAMWFDSSTKEVYSSIAKAIEESGYNPLKIDLKEHTNNITDEIIAEIRRSKFLVADFT